MKLPKHRGNLYVVVRTVLNSDGLSWNVSNVGSFLTYEAADSFAGGCAQDFRDRGFSDDDFIFDVQLTTYYDE